MDRGAARNEKLRPWTNVDRAVLEERRSSLLRRLNEAETRGAAMKTLEELEWARIVVDAALRGSADLAIAVSIADRALDTTEVTPGPRGR